MLVGWGKVLSVAVIQKCDDYMQLVHCKQFPLGTPYVTVMAYIKSICDRWKCVRAVYYDHTGTKGMDEEITKAGFPGITGIDFTKPTKHGMAMALKQQMMTSRESDKALLPADARRKFELPFDQDVQAELNVEQWESSPQEAKSTRSAILKVRMMIVSGRSAWLFTQVCRRLRLERALLCFHIKES